MSAQDGINSIASKQGVGDKSLDPDFHATAMSEVANECTRHWHKITDSEALITDDFRRIDVFANESVAPSDVTLTLPSISSLSAGYNRDLYNDSVDKYLVFLQKDTSDGGGQLVVEGIEAGQGINFGLNEAGTDFILVDIKGVAPVELDVNIYGDFDALVNADKPSNTYFITGTGNQIPNPPPQWDLQPTTPYTFIKTVLSTGTSYVEEWMFYSTFDTSNPRIGQRLVRAGGNFGGAVASGYKPENDLGAAFIATNLDATPIPVVTDSATPSFLGPLQVLYSKGITLVDAATGTMRNDTGRELTMTGTINYNPDNSGGGVVTLNIVSEKATSLGGPWVGNLESKRTIEVSNTSESFGTKLSVIVGWQPNELLRFRGWITSGALNFVVSSSTAMGQTFNSPSIAWELSEI